MIEIVEESIVFLGNIDFQNINSRSAYKGILGSLALKQLKVITSIHLLSLIFITPKGIAIVRNK